MTDLYPELSREPDILANKHLLAEYALLREAGEPHGFAAMLVLQSPPACQTDNIYFENRGTLDDQLKHQARIFAKISEQNGYRPNVRDVYEPGLARFQGDPEAFVPATGGKAHVKKVLEKRGYRVRRGDCATHGLAVEAIEEPSKPTTPLADDLVRENTVKMLRKNPELARLPKSELREAVIEKHGKPSRQLRA